MSRPVNVLIVDDVAQNIVALEALLARPGVALLCASSGEQALELLLAHEVALALLDVQMPGMDGFELAELMRGTERTRRIPIIFLTAGARDAGRMFRGYEAGAVDFLFKPIEPHVLRSKVDVFVALHEHEQRQAERVAALTEALRLNETFTAVLGHDLRNPLAAVINGAKVIERAASDALVRDAAQRIAQSGARMSRMIEQLLDVARVRTGRLDAQPAPTDLGQVCEAIREEACAGDPHCQIVMRRRGDLSGCWDADRLSQVVSNLLGNALQHGQPGCPVTLELDGSDAQHVRLAVRNAGTIPPQAMPHIFEPFRSSQPRQAGAGGLGLGLHIVDQIVRLHGGCVAVRSDAAEGTVFEVSLPRQAPAAA